MSYRVIYGAEQVIQKHKKKSARFRILIALSILIFAWTVRLLWPEGREMLAMYLLPGEPTLTEAAFSNLLENLRHGFGMADSLTVFCREVLYEII